MNDLICLVCQGNAHSLYCHKKGFQVVGCEQCGLLRLYSLPSAEWLERIYGEGYFTGDPACDGYMDYEYEKAVTRKTFEKYLGVIEKYGEKGRLFEIGAATGYFLTLALDRGWDVEGVDVSNFAVRKAQEKGLPVQQGSTETLEAVQNQHDAIVMFDVFEHLLYPAKDLQRVAGALKPGGVLVFATPDRSSLFSKLMGRRWHAIVPPQHVFLYPSKYIDTLWFRYNLEVIEKKWSGKWFTVQYMFRVLYTWLGWRPLYWLANKINGTRLGRLSFPLNLRDTMFVVARKVVD